MARLGTVLLFCAALAASAPESLAASTMVGGVYTVTFNLSIASQLPAGTTIICRARIAPSQEGLNLLKPQMAATTVESVTGLAAVTGSSATCATEIPFVWSMPSGRCGLTLSYEVDAVSHSGAAPLLVRRSAQQNLSAAFPASGGNANLSVNMTF